MIGVVFWLLLSRRRIWYVRLHGIKKVLEISWKIIAELTQYIVGILNSRRRVDDKGARNVRAYQFDEVGAPLVRFLPDENHWNPFQIFLPVLTPCLRPGNP